MEQFKNWFTPERAIGLQGLGLGLSQLAAGRAPDLSPAYQALQDRQQTAQMKGTLENSGLMQKFTPEQRAILAQMPPAAAQRIIAQQVFAQPAAPKVTDDMAEYNFARSQGYQGTLQDFINSNRQAGATVVNVGQNGIDYGTPPADMAWRRDPEGKVMLDGNGAPMAVWIKGSPGDNKRVSDITQIGGDALDRLDKQEASSEAATQSGSVVLEDIQRAQELANSHSWLSPVAGMLGPLMANIGGTKSADFEQLSQTIRANVGFDRLQAMRDASPTGGALGNVTVQELERLESVLGSLSQKQSIDQLTENLERLETIYVGILSKAAAYPNAADFGFANEGPPPVITDDDLFKQYGLE